MAGEPWTTRRLCDQKPYPHPAHYFVCKEGDVVCQGFCVGKKGDTEIIDTMEVSNQGGDE